MRRKETNYVSPAVEVLALVAGQVLCGSNDPNTSNLGNLRIDVDPASSLNDDDWE